MPVSWRSTPIPRQDASSRLARQDSSPERGQRLESHRPRLSQCRWRGSTELERLGLLRRPFYSYFSRHCGEGSKPFSTFHSSDGPSQRTSLRLTLPSLSK